MSVGRIACLASHAGEHRFTWGFRAHGLVIDLVNNSDRPVGSAACFMVEKKDQALGPTVCH